ncbi:MAG TPA: DUF3501 family protein [Hyphomicrobiales bacterium]|nr:DUF3501 family protein [Hyphomicrobiales bacterium]
MANKHALTAADILAPAAYAAIRREMRAEVSARKKNRRVAVGPHVTFYFECYDTMRLQVQEMVYIEKGGEEQVQDELLAYNPLIPNGHELVATFMIEVDDPERRHRLLGRLGGVEETAFVSVGGHKIMGVPEADQDRTTAEGKASSVQFVHFPFTAEAIAAFRQPGAQVVLGLEHPAYSHMAVMPEPVRAELAGDFD